MSFKIKIGAAAIDDIQEGIDWYNQQQNLLGQKFLADIKAHITLLKNNPHFQIRYDNVRCLPLKKFPFMIHYTLDEKENLVVVRAVFNTSIDPKLWQKRK